MLGKKIMERMRLVCGFSRLSFCSFCSDQCFLYGLYHFAIIIAFYNVVSPLFYKFEAPDSDSWFDMFVESLQDTTVIVLIVAALVSLVVGTLDDPKKG